MNKNSENLILVTSMLGLIIFCTISYIDYFIIFGDSVENMSNGREFTVPIWGHWIAPRIIGDFFPPVVLASYAKIVGALLGIRHIADVYSSFMALMLSLYFIALAYAAYCYVKLFLHLKAIHFTAFALIFYLFYFSGHIPENITLLFAYEVPLTLAIWFAYPFVAYVASGKDSLKAFGTEKSIALVAVGAYFVAFSVTNAYIFATSLIGLCGLALVVPNHSIQGGRWFGSLIESPTWFKLGVLFMSTLTVVAMIYDITSKRFTAEQDKVWASEGEIQILDSISHLIPAVPNLLLFCMILIMPLFVWHLLNWSGETTKGQSSLRLFLALGAILGSLVIYCGFLFILTNFSERNYFVYASFPKPILFFVVVFCIIPCFLFSSRRNSGFLLVPLAIIIALAGFRQLSSPPPPSSWSNATPSQSRSVFSSMYMSYCHQSQTVPIYLNNPKYPYVPIPSQHSKNWFGQSFSKIFSKFVLLNTSIRYLPEFYAVENTSDMLHELRQQRSVGINRCNDYMNSPYYINLDQ